MNRGEEISTGYRILKDYKLRFSGFDGNNEMEHLNVAEILVNDLDRFTSLKGKRSMILTQPPVLLQRCRQMYAIFEPIRASVRPPAGLTVDQIKAIVGRY